MSGIWSANAKIIREITAECDGEITAVGLSGHGKGLYLLDRDLKPLRPGIGSTDSRALDYELMWNKDGTADKVYPMTAQKVLACQPVALLRWMKDNERENYDRIGWILSVKDYIRFCLTGNVNAEYTDISGTNLLNLRTKSYDMILLEAFSIPEMIDKLPEIKTSCEVCGTVTEKTAAETGLKAGTPVVGGMFDIDACAVAMGTIKSGDMCMIAGTWSINEYITDSLIDNKTVSMNSVYCDPRFYLAEESSAASAGNLEWIRGLIKDYSYDELDKLVERVSPAASKVFYLPFLYASNENPKAKATIIGLNGSHSTSNVLRAVYEGVAFSSLTHMRKLLASRETPPKSVKLAGGVVNSELWAQIFADTINLPLDIIGSVELGAKGAAMAAGVGAGVFTDYTDAVSKCVKIDRTVCPDPENAKIYAEKYTIYRKIADSLDGIWQYM
jgi:L-xylulokinase